MRDMIDNLKKLRGELVGFKKISLKYKPGNNYYKDKFKILKKAIKSLINNSKISSNIKNVLKESLSLKNLTPKSCNELIDRIDEEIQDLEIEFESNTDKFSERIYDKKSAFKFHLDIKAILEKSKRGIFIIEPFVDDHMLELTLKDIPKSLKIDILTNSRNANKRKKFDKLANLFKNDVTGFEVRETEDLHDRGCFIDSQEGWVMGQSIKDAAKNKPTYLIKLQDPRKLENIYRKIWNQSKKVK